MPDEPFSNVARNSGFDDYWTTPCCYVDVPEKTPGARNCPECGRPVECTVETTPVAVCTLIGE